MWNDIAGVAALIASLILLGLTAAVAMRPLHSRCAKALALAFACLLSVSSITALIWARLTSG